MEQAAAKEPEQKPITILDRKKHVVKVLTDKFNSPLWLERLLKICGGDESRILKSLNSFITYIMSDDGGSDDKKKKYIADCSIASISAAFLEAFQMGIEIGGGRDHAYLINYAGTCQLDISYKGFVYALGKHFDNPFVVAENVFEGDKFSATMDNENAAFSFTANPENAFGTSWGKLKGCFCYFSYTQRISGEKVSRLIRIQKDGPDGLEMIRSKSKGSFAWKDFPFEQTKKSTLRRAAKIPFAQIDFGDEKVNPEQVDNKHYVFENSSADKLKLLLQAQEEVVHGKKAEDEAHKQGKSDTPNQGDDAAPIPKVPDDAERADAGQSIEETGKLAENDDATKPDHAAQESAQKITDATYEEVSPEVSPPAKPIVEDPTLWNGKTVYLGDSRRATKDFTDPMAAMVYIKRVISQRKHKASRVEIVKGNALLLEALIKMGKESEVAELHKLADQGE